MPPWPAPETHSFFGTSSACRILTRFGGIRPNATHANKNARKLAAEFERFSTGFKSRSLDSVQKQALRCARRRAFSLTREEVLFSLLLRLRIEKVVHHRDDDGHAKHQRDVCRVGQNGQSRFGARPHVAVNLAALQ